MEGDWGVEGRWTSVAPPRPQARERRGEVGLETGPLVHSDHRLRGGRSPSPQQLGPLLPGQVSDFGRLRVLLLVRCDLHNGVMMVTGGLVACRRGPHLANNRNQTREPLHLEFARKRNSREI